MLNVDVDLFGKMNTGSKCWYLHRVWSLIVLSHKEGKRKLLSLTSTCGPEVVSFVDWMCGVEYSRGEFLAAQIDSSLLPPLLDIVYNYLTAPSPQQVKESILSLV